MSGVDLGEGAGRAQARSLRGLDRIVVFADAVVAIACTLLVLPLVDLATQEAGVPVGRLIRDHVGQFGAFALSFVVIVRLWVGHHQLFERVGAYDTVIIWITLFWLFTVAFLPFPTAILATQSKRGAAMLYIGTLLLSSVALASTSAWVSAHPALQRTAESDAAVVEPQWTTAVLFAVAFAVTAFAPHTGVWPLLLLVLSGPIDVLRRRRSARKRSSAVGATEGVVEQETPHLSALPPDDRLRVAMCAGQPRLPLAEPDQLQGSFDEAEDHG